MDVVVAMVRVEPPPAVTLVGLNVPVAPAGKPEMPRFTAPANPLSEVVETVAVPLFPCTNVMDVGETEIPKSSFVTVRVKVALCVPGVPVPLTVTV